MASGFEKMKGCNNRVGAVMKVNIQFESPWYVQGLSKEDCICSAS
jgi:hypothetical protein